MNARSPLAVLLLALASFATAGVPPGEGELDARVHTLAQQLRCVVCQNQTLADSNAELAVDLRRQIREQLAAGADEQAVKDYLVQRYGDFVLYKPPLKPLTWLLWFGPPLLLLLVVALLARSRLASAGAAATGLDAQERRQLESMVSDPRGEHRS